MRIPNFSFLSAAAAFALLALATPGAAQTSAPLPTASAFPGQAASTLVHVSGCSTRNAGAGAEAQYVGPGPAAGQASNSSSFTTVYGDDYYQPIPGASSPVMLVSFTNISGKPMTMVEFGLLSNEILAGEARDTGTFAPGTEVKAKLGISLTAILPGETKCVPLRITFADGSKWRNPRLPPRGNAYFNSKYPPKPL